MRNVLALLLCVMFLPAVSSGRGQLFQLGVSGGFSSARMGKEVNVRPGGKLSGYNYTIKGMADFHWVQFGIGVEMGSITGDMTRIVDAWQGRFAIDYLPVREAEITGFYKAPHALLNLKLNAAKSLYFFGGGMCGVMFSKGDLLNDNFTSLLYGANAGVAVTVYKRIVIELQQGWRFTEIGDMVSAEHVTGMSRTYTNSFPFYTGHTLNYFTTNIGLRIRFGSNENRWYR